jgi:hypothetical protein
LEFIYIQTLDDIKLAYSYLCNVKEVEKKYINVY